MSSFQVERVAVVIPVSDIRAAVPLWERILGVAPTFVDADRWAQFDPPSGRICLAGTDRSSDHTAVLLKASAGQLEALTAALSDHGFEAGPLKDGSHERRRTLIHPDGGTVVLYEPIV